MENTIELVKFTKSVYGFLSKVCDIPIPTVKVDNYGSDCMSAQFDPHRKISRLVINTDFVYNEVRGGDNVFEYWKNCPRLETFEEKILLIILHEFGHFIQYHKHRDWYDRFNLNGLEMMFEVNSEQEYRETKIESNADKLAIALYNKYADILLTKEQRCATI